MSKVVVIGIDGFDPLLLIKWKEALPNLRSMYKDISEIVIESTFPPDSICAWTSIFTGENPAEHGLMESIDYLSSRKLESREDRSAHFKGKTFWDVAGDNGKDVCVINPFIAYPAWKVNGVMVSGPVFEGGDISAYPDSLLTEYDFPPLGGIVDFPDEKDLGKFINRSKDVTEQLGDVSLRIYKDRSPDLLFVTFLTLDRIKHFLWRFTDKEDAYYPGENPFTDAIKDFYLVFDGIIGRFVKSLPEDTTLLIISDHGHRRRCSKCLNLNEILRIKNQLI
ncbi:MAG: alkaline phosphatase family protein [Nitrospirae bacterium]|nr:alkaline phosphatase family protein [Nitrospirota bacterium]